MHFLVRSDEVDASTILISIGIVIVIISFFIGKSAGSYSDELERVSISLHQETNGLKKRLRVVEEELMIGIGQLPKGKQQPQTTKPVHEIIVNQILSLHTQGFSIEAIAKRSSLTSAEVSAVLRVKGVI